MASWQESDFCDLGLVATKQEIEEQLKDLRRATAAEQIVLVVSRGKTVFGSLLIAVDGANQVETFSLKPDQLFAIANMVELARETMEGPIDLESFKSELKSSQRIMLDFFGSTGSLSFHVLQAPSQSRHKEPVSGLSIYLVANIRADRVASLDESLLTKLRHSVLASTEVVSDRVRRCRERMIGPVQNECRKLCRRYGQNLDSLTEINTSSIAIKFLTAAKRLTHSDFAIYFKRSSDLARYSILCKSGEGLECQNREMEVTENQRGHNIVLDVSSLERPSISFSREADFHLDALKDHLKFGGPLGFIAAFPVLESPSRAFTKTTIPNIARAVGVLLLGSKKETTSYMGIYELTAIANAAGQLSSFEDEVLASAASATVISSAFTAPGSLARGANATDSLTSPIQNLESVPLIPSEFRQAALEVNSLLKKACELTGCATATFRVLTCDGLNLFRCAGYPHEILNNPDKEISISAKSVHSWVAKHGKSVYIGDCGNAEVVRGELGKGYSYKNSHGNMLTEFCIPLRINDKLVGTLNFESPFENALSNATTFLRSIAGVVQARMANAQQLVEQKIFDYAHAIVASTHEIAKAQREIASVIGKPNNVRNQAMLSQANNRLSQTILALEGKDSRPTKFSKELVPLLFLDVAKSRLREMLQSDVVFRFRKFQSQFSNVKNRPKLISARTIQFFSMAIRELVENAKRKRNSNNLTVTVVAELLTQNGSEYLRLLVTNSVSKRIPPSKANILFRQPIPSTSASYGFNLGAFLAGCLMRSVGGDVGLRHNGNEKVTIVVDIPIRRSLERSPSIGDGHV